MLATHPTSGVPLFLQALTAELATVQQFIHLLTIEQNALSNGDTDQLPALVEQKNGMVAQLGTFAEQRNLLLAAQGYASDRMGIESWCSDHPDEINTLSAWSTIISLAGEARELNRLNGDLIKIRMQYNASALDALLRGENSLNLYGPDGQSKILASRRINDAV